MQELRSGQARSWALNLTKGGMSFSSFPSFLAGFNGISVVFLWRRGASKASSLPAVFCHGLLFLPASGLDMDSGDCVLPWWCCGVCACAVHKCVCEFIYLCLCPVFNCLILRIPIVSLHQSRTSSVWVFATVGLLLV